MNISTLVAENREKAFVLGDYATYRTQLSRQILNLRRRLGHTNAKNEKNHRKRAITSEDVAKDHRFIQLQVFEAERAWAHALAIKAAHGESSTDNTIRGSARRHIITRLHKAAAHAQNLVELVSDKSGSKANDVDILEAEAYMRCMRGAEQFEKQFAIRHGNADAQKNAWKLCVVNYSEAHIMYTALLHHTQKDVFKEVLAGSVDPSIRYAAYQSRLPRSMPISTIARQYFRQNQETLTKAVVALYPAALRDEPAEDAEEWSDATSITDVPTTVVWRGRKAPISESAIGQGIAATSLASADLSRIFLEFSPTREAQKSLATAYDPVLTAAQETVDAVRRTLAQLAKEGVPESDGRTQDLRVTDLFANHALVSWRIGRNRVVLSSLASLDDGLYMSAQLPPNKKKSELRRLRASKEKSSAQSSAQKESIKHTLARLQTRLTLYSSILQSLDSVSTLPGAARDASFVTELASQRAYFHSLTLLNLAYAHRAVQHDREALSLLAKAHEVLSKAPQDAFVSKNSSTSPPSAQVTAQQSHAARAHIAVLLQRQHGLVALQELTSTSNIADKSSESAQKPTPLVYRLDRYASTDPAATLANLVQYPPRPEPVPVKPVFLDLAFNYLEYPSDGTPQKGAAQKQKQPAAAAQSGGRPAEEDTRKSRGWFGFGRS